MESQCSRDNRIRYDEKIERLVKRDRWDNKIRDFRIYDSTKLKDRVRKRVKGVKEEIRRHMNEQFVDTRYAISNYRNSLKKTFSNKHDDQLHVEDRRTAFRLAKCGRGYVFQSLLNPDLYMAVDHCPQTVNLRSSRLCRFSLEAVQGAGPVDVSTQLCTAPTCYDERNYVREQNAYVTTLLEGNEYT